jgi:hypothetical protein
MMNGSSLSYGRVAAVLLGWSIALAPSLSFAQTADELAKQTQNPVASLISVPFQGNWDFGKGDRDAAGTTLNIQPVAPFPLTKDWNIILRVIMPALSQPGENGERFTGMGDTTMTVFFAPSKVGKIIWGAGPAVLIPTATNNALGTEKFGIGPSVVALVQPGKWTVGALWNQIWSVDGATDRADVNQMFLQPFVNYNLGQGMALGAQIESSTNWELDDHRSSNFLIFSVSKVTLLGKRPVSFAAGAGPEFGGPADGPDWRLRFTATFLFPR